MARFGEKGFSFSLQRLYLFGTICFGGYFSYYFVTSHTPLTSLSRDIVSLRRLADDVTLVPSYLPQTEQSYLEKCPERLPGLVGQIEVNMSEPESFDDILPLYNGNRRLEIGGKWRPSNCTSISHLAVVMTYRNRSKSIKLMLQHLHGFLQKQLIQYQMFVIEPPPDTEFNRGLLKNIGFVESGKFGDFQCVVFQDIDLLPENDRNLYHCPTVPRHLVVAIDATRYKPLYGGAVFGGAVLFRREQFQKINGFSNYYFGWGGEDDDLLDRVRHGRLKIGRPSSLVGRYRSVKHKKDQRGNTTRAMYIARKGRFNTDGLNTLEYSVLQVVVHPLYTWIYVGYNETFYKIKAAAARKEAETGHFKPDIN